MRIIIFITVLLAAFPAYSNNSNAVDAFVSGAVQIIVFSILFGICRWVIKMFKGSNHNSNKATTPQCNTNRQFIDKPSTTESYIKATESNKVKSSSIFIEESINKKSTPWEEYEEEYPYFAIALEYLTDEDLTQLQLKDIKEKESSFQRMASELGCALNMLKDVCLNDITAQFSKDELPEVLERLDTKIVEECRLYNIPKENTISYYISKWIREYISEKK